MISLMPRLIPALFCLPIVASAALFAQQGMPQPAEILTRLDSNRVTYYRNVPDFFCAERVVSQMRPNASAVSLMTTVTDSVFRLKRTSDPKQGVVFNESRIIKSVDGKPVSAEDAQLQGPTILSGVFSGGLDLITTGNQACYDYHFHPHTAHGSIDRILVDFQQKAPDKAAKDCPPYERSSGRVTLDAATMQVRKIEKSYPHHELVPDVFGHWEWTAEYSEVRLGEKTLWLPLKIHSYSVADSIVATAGRTGQPGQNTTWDYDATYSGCHRTGATMRILGPNEVPAMPPASKP